MNTQEQIDETLGFSGQTYSAEVFAEIIDKMCPDCRKEIPLGPDGTGKYFHGIRTCNATVIWEALAKRWRKKVLREVNEVDNFKDTKKRLDYLVGEKP